MRKIIFIIPIILFLISPFRIFASDIVLNELQVEPSNNQWVELYNKGQQVVDISGWVIDDDGGTQKYTIENNISLPPQKCLSFSSGNFNFNTTSSDSARLIANNEVIDTYSYSQSLGENISFGRSVDGGGDWITFSSSTRDKLNTTGELCLAPTSTPTPTNVPTTIPTAIPTSSPTNSPAPSSSPKPQATATKYISPTVKLAKSGSDLNVTEGLTPVATQRTVLGEVSQVTVTPVEEKIAGGSSKSSLPVFLGLLGSGLLFIAAAVVMSIKQIGKPVK